MSLSDYIKYLRAIKGGATPWEIAEQTGVTPGDIHFIEVKHRRVGEDDDLLGRLAEYFGVEVSDLKVRREAYRKLLTVALEECKQKSKSLALRLESGEEIEGAVAWYSREAVAVAPHGSGDESYPYVVQRAWVADWRTEGDAEWQVASVVQDMESATQA